jgi:hypothetical protein
MNGSEVKGGIMETSKVIEKEGDIGLKARTVLWYLTFFGFAINYIIRINASITIVDMIDATNVKPSSNKTIVTSECIAERNFSLSPELSNELNLAESEKYLSPERRLLDFLGVSPAAPLPVSLQCQFLTH